LLGQLLLLGDDCLVTQESRHDMAGKPGILKINDQDDFDSAWVLERFG
jgi:hypothetical protein